MDYIRLTIGLLPQTLGGKVAFGAVGALGALYLLSYPYKSIQYNREEKYKLSVCWEHYLLYFKASEDVYKYSPKEISRRKFMYNECIHAARTGGKIYPPAL